MKFWRVLLDSGFDGVLTFVDKEAKSKLLTKKKLNSQKWHTSAGEFSSSKVANVEFKIPEFLNSKTIRLSPDVVKYLQRDSKPLYDLIIGLETLHELNCVLDFAEQSITLDGITLPMRKLESVQDPKVVFPIYHETLEPVSTREETNCTV